MESIARFLKKCRIIEEIKEIINFGVPVESQFSDLEEAQ
jgi:hypothetical protein